VIQTIDLLAYSSLVSVFEENLYQKTNNATTEFYAD